MMIGGRCVTMSIKKKGVFVLITIIGMCMALVGCTPNYVIHKIAYSGDTFPLRPAIIRNIEDLDSYFSQEDYIQKNEFYEESISQFTSEFFENKVLLPINYSKENYKIKSIKVNKEYVEVTLKFKSGLRPDVADSLYFLEINIKDIGEASEAKILYK